MSVLSPLSDRDRDHLGLAVAIALIFAAPLVGYSIGIQRRDTKTVEYSGTPVSVLVRPTRITYKLPDDGLQWRELTKKGDVLTLTLHQGVISRMGYAAWRKQRPANAVETRFWHDAHRG